MHKAVAGQTYQMQLLDSILEVVKTGEMLQTPAVAVYYHAYLMLQSPEEDAPSASRREVHAAAMSVQGYRFAVVLVPLDLISRPGEADMAIADLRPRFGGVDVVLMGQDEDGTPSYHGDATLRELLDHIPVDRMPWKPYPVG